MIVVDASVLVDFLIGRPERAAVETTLREGAPYHAPHLIDVEVSQVIRRLALAGLIAVDRAEACFADFGQMLLTRHSHVHHLERIWQLRRNLNAYDGAYVALAEALNVPLVTRDAKLTAPGLHAARIILV